MATQVRGTQTGPPARPGPAKPERTSPAVFVREIRSELRKVIWPTRKELVTYTTVSVIFILAMVAIVSGVDTGLAKLVFAIFG